MDVRVRVAMKRGVYLFSQVVTIWSDGQNLRVQHHEDQTTVLALSQVRDVERIDDPTVPSSGWAQRQMNRAFDMGGFVDKEGQIADWHH